MSRPGTALNGDAPKAMVAKILGFQAKEEEESQGTIQQLNTNVRAKADASETPRLQRQACRLPRLQIAFCHIIPPFEKACPQALPSLLKP